MSECSRIWEDPKRGPAAVIELSGWLAGWLDFYRFLFFSWIWCHNAPGPGRTLKADLLPLEEPLFLAGWLAVWLDFKRLSGFLVDLVSECPRTWEDPKRRPAALLLLLLLRLLLGSRQLVPDNLFRTSRQRRKQVTSRQLVSDVVGMSGTGCREQVVGIH